MSDLTLPIARQHPFDPPEEVMKLSEQAPIHRMRFGDDTDGWLVTGYELARAVLADPRFSNRPEFTHPPLAARAEFAKAVKSQDVQMPAGLFLRMDAPEHTRYRKLLTGQFTVRRMRMLEPRIAEIVEQHLDAMEAGERPVDLVEAFALPIPSLVICELLGVPYEDRESFQRDARIMLNLETKAEDVLPAMGRVFGYLHELIQRKRAQPDEHLLSGLVQTGELNDEELTGVAFILLIAGHETTANMLGLGTYALLSNPAQLEIMRDDPSATEGAVEELLRYLTIIHIGPVRTALEDLTIGGVTVREGEGVALSFPAINRDSERFDEPSRLDLRRESHGHISFGHGIHQCLGQQLARVEMRIGYPALLRRFPGLRLAVAPEEVPMRTDMTIYGVHRLPVTW
ncbi:MAG: cytochrome P450 [Nonomuraea sp.]|nr:cytochrome P450 [Nonomuraea sp.]